MRFKTLLLAAVATAALAAPSIAAPILAGSQVNINGFVRGNGADIDSATALDFTNGLGATPGVAGTLTASNGTGSFDGLLNCAGACGTINDISNLATFSGLLYTLTGGLSFTLTETLMIDRTPAALPRLARLDLSGFGILGGGGFDATRATFTLTAQGGSITSFSASAIAVPAPMSLALFGMGLLGLGLVRGRKAA